MKKYRAAVIAAILFAVPMIGMAATRKNVTLAESVQVGTQVLKPGDYLVEWNGSGPQVQVNFVSGRKTLATLPATVKKQQNPYDFALVLDPGPNKSAKSLRAIDFKGMSLVFKSKAAQPGM
jgi:hypothetical protein